MDRIYRVEGMGGRYALERDGGLYWLEGHVFGDYHVGMLIEETAPEVRGAGACRRRSSPSA